MTVMSDDLVTEKHVGNELGAFSVGMLILPIFL